MKKCGCLLGTFAVFLPCQCLISMKSCFTWLAACDGVCCVNEDNLWEDEKSWRWSWEKRSVVSVLHCGHKSIFLVNLMFFSPHFNVVSLRVYNIYISSSTIILKLERMQREKVICFFEIHLLLMISGAAAEHQTTHFGGGSEPPFWPSSNINTGDRHVYFRRCQLSTTLDQLWKQSLIMLRETNHVFDILWIAFCM